MKMLWAPLLSALLIGNVAASERICAEEAIPPDLRQPPSVVYHVFYFDQPMMKHLCEYEWLPEAQGVWGCASWQMEEPETWHIYIDEALSEEDLACVLLHEKAHLPPNNWVHRGVTNEIPGSMFRRVKPVGF